MARARFGFLIIMIAVIVLTAGCAQQDDALVLVEEADAMLIDGGIENAKTRELAQQKYDRAIRLVCGEEDFFCVKQGSAASKSSEAYILAHAHFGLAFARTFDLIDRIRQLYVSDVLNQEVLEEGGEASESDIDQLCRQQQNLPQFVPLLRTIVKTSLLPIIEDFKAVTAYPDFEITYNTAFLNLSFLEEGLSKEQQADTSRRSIGVFFGADDENSRVGPGKIGQPEVHLLLGVFRLITIGAELVFSYNDLTQVALVFGGKFNTSVSTSPYNLARAFNTDPCYPNPLFDPSFGVLTELGRETFHSVRGQMKSFFVEQSSGLALLRDRADEGAILNYSRDGAAWGTNFVERLKSGVSSGDKGLLNLTRVLTGLMPPDQVSGIFSGLNKSLQEGVPFDLATYTEQNEDLSAQLALARMGIREFGVPAVNLKQFFNSPVADLKSVMPLSYAASEMTSYTDVGGVRQVLQQERPRDAGTRTLYFADANGDGHWNQRGDFIIQPEREAFYDTNNNDTPPMAAGDMDRGVLGTFWDADKDGIPDLGFEFLIPGAGAGYYVTAATDAVVLFKNDEVPLMENDKRLEESTSFRNVWKLGVNDLSGCLQPTKNSQDQVNGCNLRIGDILGHVWPSLYPEPFTAPSIGDSRRRDPANGTHDGIYLFFPNPDMSGVLLKPADQSGVKYQPFGNHDLNRLLNNVLNAQERINDLLVRNQE